MAQMIEMSEQGDQLREKPKPAGFAIGPMIRKMLANPAALKKMRTMSPDEERYVRPPREYELPAYRQGMPHCTSNEKYLRPTHYCNPREPLIIAMTNELGAYELSDWEFAEAAFWFVKTKLVAEMLPFDSVSATLRRGTGTCYHLTSLWIALCRAAGIKARYKTFNMMLAEGYTPFRSSEQSAMTWSLFNTGTTPEGEGEVCIDGKWVVGHVAMRPEILARGYLPITRFGEDAVGNTFPVVPGTIRRFESMSLWFGPVSKVVFSLIPAAMERVNVVIHTKALPEGRRIIDEAGGIEVYDRKARERLKRSFQIVELEDNEALVFKDE